MKTNPKTYHSIDQLEAIRLQADRAAQQNGRQRWTISRLAAEIGISPAAYHLWKLGGGRYESSIERTEAVVQKMLAEIGE